jgi:hypothetical protein
VEEQQAAARLGRVERDYTDGELSAANYERLSAKLADELDAARAHREQLQRQAAAFERRRCQRDACPVVPGCEGLEELAEA